LDFVDSSRRYRWKPLKPAPSFRAKPAADGVKPTPCGCWACTVQRLARASCSCRSTPALAA
ncbi:serine transporter, partial [Klebsiella pneumoniae]